MRLALARAALRLAPAHARETLLGDLLEEHETVALPRLGRTRAALWLLAECARSAAPLALWRARRAGPERVALACVSAGVAAAAAHAAGNAAWHGLLAQVPLRAFHEAPLAWRLVLLVAEGMAALAGAGFVVTTGWLRRGGRR